VDLSRRVRSLRQARGWSQAELGRRAGISTHHVLRIELGHQSPTVTVLKKLAAALRVKPSRLLD
jgi:transcriptional regulator with XRE-family HTH domain